MNGNGVQAIAQLAVSGRREPKVIEIGGRQVLALPVGDNAWEVESDHPQLDPAAPLVPVLLIHTLSGLSDYVRVAVALPEDGASSPSTPGVVPPPPSHVAHFDKVDAHDLAVHVVNEREVLLLSKVEGDHPQRQVRVRVAFEPLLGNAAAGGFQFGQFLDLEKFNIGLQALFVDTPDRAAVLKVLGNIRDEKVATVGDDGTGQAVTLRAGIIRNSEASVPNPVTLAPFRTFREVPQPASKFVLRVRPGKENELPTAALFEADGGAWRLEAIDHIKWFLAHRLPGALPIFA